MDVFVRPVYNDIVVESLVFCKEHLGLELYCWCIMPSHIHLIFRVSGQSPQVVLGRFKEYTSKKIVRAIETNPQESRRDWMLPMFNQAASSSSNVQRNQFWQHDNHPIELWSPEVIEQKADYIHYNPVVAGLVNEPEHWVYSSAIDYAGGKGLIEIEYL